MSLNENSRILIEILCFSDFKSFLEFYRHWPPRGPDLDVSRRFSTFGFGGFDGFNVFCYNLLRNHQNQWFTVIYSDFQWFTVMFSDLQWFTVICSDSVALLRFVATYSDLLWFIVICIAQHEDASTKQKQNKPLGNPVVHAKQSKQGKQNKSKAQLSAANLHIPSLSCQLFAARNDHHALILKLC